MLEARGIDVSIRGKKLLNQLSLKITPGEFMVVVGPNGAGKSTLLKALTGEQSISFGEILMNGSTLKNIPTSEQAKVRAVLPQDSSLNFPFRVHEVVAMGRSPHQGSGANIDEEIIASVLEEVDVTELFDRDYTTLSGGERQRVQIARVLAQIWNPNPKKPHYLLLDEPTSALDLSHQHSVLGIARKIMERQNIGVLAVLHDLNLAAYYADHIAVLKDGRLLCQGTPQEVLTPERIEEAFGTPALVLPHPLRENCPLIVTPVHKAADASHEHSRPKLRLTRA